MKTYTVTLKSGKEIEVKAASLGDPHEGVVALYNESDAIVASFPVAEFSCIVESE